MLHFVKITQVILAAVAITATAVADDNATAEQALPQGVQTSWWSEVQRTVAEEEYHATMQSDGLQAPNRAHNLRTRFDMRGAVTTPRSANGKDSHNWQWGLALDRVGWAGGPLANVSPAEPAPNRNKVSYNRGNGLTEWYVNDPNGLRSWYKLENAPPGKGDWLRLELAIRGNTTAVVRGDDSLAFLTSESVEVIHYGGLKAWDAAGKELNCQLHLLERETEDGFVCVALDIKATGAKFPVTIDPFAISAAWTAESDRADGQFGNSVASAGDVNGDGYSDVIVGAHIYNNGEINEGRAYVYLGSASGLSASAAWTAESDQERAYFGYSVASAGDVNGDGYSDVIVGAYMDGYNDEGRAYVYLGSASGMSATAAWTAESNQAGARFGKSVASAGDVNGDGYSDVIVGAYFYNNGQVREGRAYVYLGSPSGLSAGAAWTAESDQPYAYFGGSVASAGDVNGDGYSDVIIGAESYSNGEPSEGRAYVYLGSASGLSASAAWTAESDHVGGTFGSSVASAGDVNSDGYSDVIIGAERYDNGEIEEGRAYVYLGSPSGLSASAAWTAESDQAGAFFGRGVASAGDLNGDGYSDVVVGAYKYDNGESDEGRAYFYRGSASGLAAGAAWIAESDQANAIFGVSVASAGDVNGDGYFDVIVGAPGYDNGEMNEGRAYLFRGADPAGVNEWSLY